MWYTISKNINRLATLFRKGISRKDDKNMLWTIVIILLILWALGLVTSTTFGGLIHILIVIALIVVVVNLLRGRSKS